jgi:hypothetical protein
MTNINRLMVTHQKNDREKKMYAVIQANDVHLYNYNRINFHWKTPLSLFISHQVVKEFS